MERAPVNEQNSLRLFIALPVPPAVKEDIQGTQRELQSLLPRSTIGWTRPEQIHLTLRFFGNVQADDLAPINSALQNACTDIQAFDMIAENIDVFPNKRHPRIIWVGVRELTGVLASLHKRISEGTASFGQEPEDRPFSPHLTIGRIKQVNSTDAQKLHAFIEKHARHVFGQWTASNVELIKSELGKDGSKYTLLETGHLE